MLELPDTSGYDIMKSPAPISCVAGLWNSFVQHGKNVQIFRRRDRTQYFQRGDDSVDGPGVSMRQIGFDPLLKRYSGKTGFKRYPRPAGVHGLEYSGCPEGELTRRDRLIEGFQPLQLGFGFAKPYFRDQLVINQGLDVSLHSCRQSASL